MCEWLHWYREIYSFIGQLQQPTWAVKFTVCRSAGTADSAHLWRAYSQRPQLQQRRWYRDNQQVAPTGASCAIGYTGTVKLTVDRSAGTAYLVGYTGTFQLTVCRLAGVKGCKAV